MNHKAQMKTRRNQFRTMNQPTKCVDCGRGCMTRDTNTGLCQACEDSYSCADGHHVDEPEAGCEACARVSR